MSVHEMLLLVFCLIDDEMQDPELAGLRSRGPDPLLRDSEALTIEVVAELLGYDRDARLFWFFRHYHGAEFPGLPRAHRTTFARQAANLWKAKQVIQSRLAERLNGADGVWLIDSMPLPVCRFGRGGYARGFRGEASYGYDGVQKQVFYGFRLHLRTSRDGAILAGTLTPANAHDLDAARDLEPPPGTAGIGDRNYNSAVLAEDLERRGVRLLVPPRVRRTGPDPRRSARLGRVRWKVEGVNGQLADRYRIKRLWARGLWHLCHRAGRKILSHTVAVWLNVTAGRQPLRFADLFAA